MILDCRKGKKGVSEFGCRMGTRHRGKLGQTGRRMDGTDNRP